MKKPLLDHMRSAVRMFVLLTFFTILVTSIVGYCILPDQIVSLAFPGNITSPRNPYSKEFFLGMYVGLAFFFTLLTFLAPFLTRKLKPGHSNDYWDREENFVLKKAIIDLWYVFGVGMMLLLLEVTLIRHFSVNLASPPRGIAWSVEDQLILALILLMSTVFRSLTLAIVKRYRQHHITTQHKQQPGV